MAGKASWLESGLQLLGAEGPAGLTIDRLVQRTGLTTGSFYHHFAGMAGFRSALLGHFEEVYTTRYICQVEAAEGLDPHGRIQLLIDLVLDTDEPVDIDTALRAWALGDPIASAATERIDKVRLDYLRGLLLDAGYPEPDALATARTLYLMVVGASSVVPAVPPEELRELCRRVLR